MDCHQHIDVGLSTQTGRFNLLHFTLVHAHEKHTCNILVILICFSLIDNVLTVILNIRIQTVGCYDQQIVVKQLVITFNQENPNHRRYQYNQRQ